MNVLRERALFLAVVERNYRNNVVDVGENDLGKRIVADFNRFFSVLLVRERIRRTRNLR